MKQQEFESQIVVLENRMKLGNYEYWAGYKAAFSARFYDPVVNAEQSWKSYLRYRRFPTEPLVRRQGFFACYSE